MRGGFDEGHETQRVVALHLATSFEGTWLNVLLPWFDEIARSPLAAAPSAVVTPSRSLAQLLRARLLARDISILGLKFLSPAQLRELLLPNNQNIPLREHLRLLLAIAAERLATEFDEEKQIGR